jgi:protein O-GlcNAc transferase
MAFMATIPQSIAIAVGHHQARRLQEAERIYRQILEVEPDHAQALHLLGLIAYQVGQYDISVAYIGRAIGFKGTDAAFHSNLGLVFQAQGKLEEAVASCRRATEIKPDYADAHGILGSALAAQGKLDEAIACFHRALQLKPEFFEAHSNLGNALKNQGRPNEAAACYRRALETRPDSAEIHSNLGCALADQGMLDEAGACYRRALDLNPEFFEAHGNLASALKDQGRPNEAAAHYRRALELKPDAAEVRSNLIFALSFSPDCDTRPLSEELRRWNQQHAEPLAASIRPHTNDRAPERRLRVGYVSPDFRSHPVGRFVLPLLETHDRGNFEIICYNSWHISDAITGRCRAAADGWRDAMSLADEQLACAIRADRIDILVDLAMHTAHNRLLAFARKPAPVQVTYLAYCGTTGLRMMDYRLTDPYLDPPGQTGGCYSEESVWLPRTYWCYRPTDLTPPVSDLPALRGGPVTFGCLNNFCKVTAPTLAVWSRLLQALPQSRLLLHAHPGSHRDRVQDLFTQAGVAPERITFTPRLPIADYLRNYERIDIALDPFPYGGGTTTCDALWMGVPVVTLAGETAVGRGGLSILSNAGLSELVALDTEQYVRIAVALANDLPRLRGLRATLRQRMEASPLMDAPRFARDVETAFRALWRRWCS